MKNIKQEPCEEAISRQAVLSKIKEVCFSEEWGQFRVDNGSNGQRDFLINYIEQLPPVTPQAKTGHWTERKMHKGTGFFLPTCSECGSIQPYAHHTFSWNYCPNCGAKMEEAEE